MSDDLLAQMTSALADEHDGATAVPEATRARVIRTLAERKPRRRKWFVVGVPAFVLFGGSTAWAGMTGHLPAVVEQVITTMTLGAVEFEEAPPKKKIRTRVFKRRVAPVVEEAAEEKALEAPGAEEPAELAEAEEVDEPAAPLLPPLKKKRAPALDASLSTYQSAHRAQFRSGDCSAAVRGYADYLNEAPRGSFATDARYNRAVCLIKLGRTSEARALLKPFSEGRYGSHRQKRAQELLEAFE